MVCRLCGKWCRVTAADYCAKMWFVSTSYLSALGARDYLLLTLPNYLIVGPDGLWEFGHAIEQDSVFSDGYLLAGIGKMSVPSWIQLV